MYMWQQVKALRQQGYHVKQIARRLKISKNTVKKYLKSSDPPEFQSREYTKKSDPYTGEIKAMIKKGYIGTRIYEELTAAGFTGSLSTVERVVPASRVMVLSKRFTLSHVKDRISSFLIPVK